MSADAGRYSVQAWLDNTAQGYLLGREHGHLAGQQEPEWLLASPPLLARAVRVTAHLVAAERCSLAATAGLVRLAPDEETQRFLATQVLDEARHVEIFSQRLLDLGVTADRLDATIAAETSANFVHFEQGLLATIDRRDFFASIIAHNVLLEGVTLAVFGLLHAAQVERNPKFAHMLAGTLADERRHAGFGETQLTPQLRRDPALRARAERLQGDLAHWLVGAFNEVAREAPVEPVRRAGTRRDEGAPAALLVHRLEEEIRMRLARLGLEYRRGSRS